jgi:hypothetical protein
MKISEHKSDMAEVPPLQPNRLDSFEAVMKAMDEELTRNRSKLPHTSTMPAASKGKGKGKASETEEHEDIEAAMDAELQAALEGESDDEGDEEPINYTMIKNFLESFKSQAGLSGPVSNLAGRLHPGWNFPRDES